MGSLKLDMANDSVRLGDEVVARVVYFRFADFERAAAFGPGDLQQFSNEQVLNELFTVRRIY